MRRKREKRNSLLLRKLIKKKIRKFLSVLRGRRRLKIVTFIRKKMKEKKREKLLKRKKKFKTKFLKKRKQCKKKNRKNTVYKIKNIIKKRKMKLLKKKKIIILKKKKKKKFLKGKEKKEYILKLKKNICLIENVKNIDFIKWYKSKNFKINMISNNYKFIPFLFKKFKKKKNKKLDFLNLYLFKFRLKKISFLLNSKLNNEKEKNLRWSKKNINYKKILKKKKKLKTALLKFFNIFFLSKTKKSLKIKDFFFKIEKKKKKS